MLEYLPYLYATILGVVTAGMVFYMIRTDKVEVTDFHSALDAFWKAKELVMTYVPAADQLMKVGVLKTNEEKLNYVMEIVLEYMGDFDPDKLRGIVEWYVSVRKENKANG